MPEYESATEEAVYTRPTSQIDLEERQAVGHQSRRAKDAQNGTHVEPDDGKARSFLVEGNTTEAYVGGVNPEYQCYANETEAPSFAEDGPEAQVEEEFVTQVEKRELDEPSKETPESTPETTPYETWTPSI